MIKEYFIIIFIKKTVISIIKRLFNKNTVGAYVMQAEKGVFAFAFMPLLANRLGISVFGVFSTFFSLSIIAGVIIEWGLTQTAIKSLAIAKNQAKSYIVGAVILTRFALTIPVACIVLVFCFIALPMDGNLTLVVLTVLSLYAVSISPVFVFQSNEKTLEIGSVLLVVRILATLLIYAYVETPDDLNMAFTIHLCSIYMGVGAGWAILVVKYRLQIYFVSTRKIRSIIADGHSFAFANIGSSLYGNGSVFLLSLVSSSAQVGLFNLALTFTRGICSVLTPVSQSYLPKISRLYEESVVKARSAVRKALILQTLAACTLVVIVWIVLIYLIPVGFHDNMRELSLLIILLSSTIVSTLISSLLVLFVIIPMKMDQFYRNLIVISSTLSSACLLFLGYFYQSYGAALSIMIGEMIICIIIYNRSMRVIGSKSE
jgi:PST family polysaccharide transporter